MNDDHNVAADDLRSFFDRLVRLDGERRGIADDMREVRSEAKAHGFDPAALTKMLARYRKDPMELITADGVLATYEAALGINAQAVGVLSTSRRADGSFDIMIVPPQETAAAKRLTRKQEKLREQVALAAASAAARKG